MKALQQVFWGIALVMAMLIVWDVLPFYANADSDVAEETMANATFAGGCFWCLEKPFDDLKGVVATTSGYTGGDVANPSYYEVSEGTTGHLEAVRVTYDPTQISYDELLTVFWRNIDPLDANGQFCDKGSQYRSAIFVGTEDQQLTAEQSKQALDAMPRFSGAIATEILPEQPFYLAEDYHQDYYLKHPVRYKIYRFGCGRDQRLSELWGSTDN